MRKSFWLSAILVLAVALSLALMSLMQHHINKNSSKTKHQVEAYFNGLKLVKYNLKGQVHNTIQSAKLTLFSNKIADIDHPKILLYTTNRTPWVVTSNKGTSYNNGQKIYLQGHVIFVQKATKGNPQLTLKTNTLWVYPKTSAKRSS